MGGRFGIWIVDWFLMMRKREEGKKVEWKYEMRNEK